MNNWIISVGEGNKYNTRQKDEIRIKLCKKSAAQKWITYASFEMFNKLPTQLKMVDRMDEFESLLSDYVKQEEMR